MNANAPGPSNSGDTDTNKSSANTINHQLAHIQSLLTSQLHQTQQWLTEEQERAAEADRQWVKEGERREDIATVLRDIEGMIESRGKRGGRGEGHSGGEQNDQESKNEDTNRLMTIVQEAHNERMEMLQSFFIGKSP
ncbi:hypothetical protein ONZ45_g17877 [Pleurotus djamor]|nr:hypothetical protein ONZ45_g17877 [Pleurotus djamor]